MVAVAHAPARQIIPLPDQQNQTSMIRSRAPEAMEPILEKVSGPIMLQRPPRRLAPSATCSLEPLLSTSSFLDNYPPGSWQRVTNFQDGSRFMLAQARVQKVHWRKSMRAPALVDKPWRPPSIARDAYTRHFLHRSCSRYLFIVRDRRCKPRKGSFPWCGQRITTQPLHPKPTSPVRQKSLLMASLSHPGLQ